MNNLDSNNKLSILIIHLEFGRWCLAKSWSYQTQLGLIDGFTSNSVKFREILNPFGGMPINQQWVDHIKKVIGPNKFDQVWVEVVHSNYDDDFLNYLRTLAPVRVAMIAESLYYTEEECVFAPILRNRYKAVKNKLKHFTHVIAVDEYDVADIKKDIGISTFWWVPGMPKSSVSLNYTTPKYDKAIFSGPLYGYRKSYLANHDLSKYMAHLPPPNSKILYPSLFNLCQAIYKLNLIYSYNIDSNYVTFISILRNRLFKSWIFGLNRGFAVVQLPHFVKAFPGRIYEGMAAGRPVVTMKLTDRPDAMSLFEPDKEIFFYQTPEDLVEILGKLSKDTSTAKLAAKNATNKILKYHTNDIRVAQILTWIQNSNLPKYF